MALLAQVISLEHLTPDASGGQIDAALMKATALLAELEPNTATEALLAVQLIGTQQLAMTFLTRATVEGQTVDSVDRNVVRTMRLMRIFTEQLEAMGKLKGKGGQQRVVVEHVTVTAGDQAIVGTVRPGGRGTSGENRQ
jgi:hypothetical protein